jgi:DNA ligase (NAD+)
VNGVGKIVAESVLAWFADVDNLKLLDKFNALSVVPQTERLDQKPGQLTGQNFAITGTLVTMSRDQAADKIRVAGGEFQNTVGKSTTYLIVGGKIGASKRAAAERYGTKIISEPEFLDLLK